MKRNIHIHLAFNYGHPVRVTQRGFQLQVTESQLRIGLTRYKVQLEIASSSGLQRHCALFTRTVQITENDLIRVGTITLPNTITNTQQDKT